MYDVYEKDVLSLFELCSQCENGMLARADFREKVSAIQRRFAEKLADFDDVDFSGYIGRFNPEKAKKEMSEQIEAVYHRIFSKATV